ncbi:MAG: hypothetical protein AAGK74_08190, partial [Chloroflexota bacterium]
VWAIFLTLVLSSLSVSVGRSYMLLANHIRPLRLAVSMLYGVVVFGFSLLVWTTAVYWAGRLYFDIDFTWNYWEITGIVILAFAPLSQAWIGLLPYVGGCWVRFLYVLCVLLLYLYTIIIGFQPLQALGALLIGGAALIIAQFTILRPVLALQNRIAGTHLRRRYSTVIRESRLELGQ